jgi:hypothetical protein
LRLYLIGCTGSFGDRRSLLDGLRIGTVDWQFPNVLTKVDRMSQTLSLLPCGLWRSRSTRGWGKCMRDQGGSFFVRSNTASNFFGLSVRLDVFPLALFTQTPDSELDVIDGGLWTIPAHESGNSRIRRSRAAILSFSLLFDFARSLRPSFRGRIMSRIQTRKATCSSGLAPA